jgi:hypothetical protein
MWMNPSEAFRRCLWCIWIDLGFTQSEGISSVKSGLARDSEFRECFIVHFEHVQWGNLDQER